VISQVKCFVTGTVLFLGAISAFANSTAFNGYVQAGGSTGIDLSSLDGGTYRITVTRAGQLNFRYVIGGQAFDSNPEAAIQDAVSNGDDTWNNSSTYTAASSVSETPVLGTAPSAYNPVFGLYDAQSQARAQLSSSEDLQGVQVGTTQVDSNSVSYSDGLTGSNFYTQAARPVETLQLPPPSLLAMTDSSPSFFYANDNPFFSTQEVPEPTTIALLAGGLLLMGVFLRKLRVEPRA